MDAEFDIENFGDIGIEELSEMSVNEVEYVSNRRDLSDQLYSEIGDSRVVSGPDIDKWQTILMSNAFADELYLMDEMFLDNGYEAELHVGRDSFRQVEYDSFPRPEPLRLRVANEYGEFMEEVSHPFFDRMEEDEWRTPRGSSVEIGFGSYDETEVVDLGLEAMGIRVPTFMAYSSDVIRGSFGSDRIYGSLDG